MGKAWQHEEHRAIQKICLHSFHMTHASVEKWALNDILFFSFINILEWLVTHKITRVTPHKSFHAVPCKSALVASHKSACVVPCKRSCVIPSKSAYGVPHKGIHAMSCKIAHVTPHKALVWCHVEVLV